MVDRAQGRKKSEFVQQSTVLANSYLDYVVNGTNYKISYDNFVSGLGVTGTIVQDGAATGTPILDVDGSINQIRNLENGPGIVTSVSSENGAKISHNFTASVVGLPILLNTTLNSPTIASIVAGSGISVAVSNSSGIEISSIADEIYGQLTIHNNTTATVIGTQSTAVLVAGTWAAGINSSFTLTTGGRMTYTGTTTEVVAVMASVTLAPSSGVNKDLSVYIAKDGVVISAAKISRQVSSTESANVSLAFNVSLSNSDYLELFVANDTDTTDILVTDALFGVS